MASVTAPGWGSVKLGGTIGVLHGDAKLRVAHWPAEPGGPGTIIIVQGRADFIEVFAETITDLRNRGYAVVAFDLRGQGGSQRVQPAGGHVRRVADYGTDIANVVGFAKAEGLPRPYHIIAHSTGGLAALCAIKDLSKDIDRMVLLAPLMEIPRLPMAPGLARMIGAFMVAFGQSRRLVGKRSELNPFETNRLTTDRARYETLLALARDNPHLMIDCPTYGWMSAVLTSMKELESRIGMDLPIPTLFIASGNDEVVGNAAIDRFARSAPGGGVIVIKGAQHHVLLERDSLRNMALKAIDAFLDSPPRLPLELPKPGRRLKFDPAPPEAETPLPVRAKSVDPVPEPVVASAVTPPEEAATSAPRQPEPGPAPPVTAQAPVPAPTPSPAVMRAREKLRERLKKRIQSEELFVGDPAEGPPHLAEVRLDHGEPFTVADPVTLGEPTPANTKRPKLTDVFTGDDVPEAAALPDAPAVQAPERDRPRPLRVQRSTPAEIDRADKPIRRSGLRTPRPVKRSRSGALGPRKP
ncbi:MAG: alpha/beta fold hydrolase [Pseudomonadota bacterium]